MRYNLGLLSPVDEAGRFTAEAGARFEGMAVQEEGNRAVTEALQEVRGHAMLVIDITESALDD